MLVQTASDMDRCAATFAVTAYVIANMEERLPRSGDYPVEPSVATSVSSSHLAMAFTLSIVVLLQKSN